MTPDDLTGGLGQAPIDDTIVILDETEPPPPPEGGVGEGTLTVIVCRRRR